MNKKILSVLLSSVLLSQSCMISNIYASDVTAKTKSNNFKFISWFKNYSKQIGLTALPILGITLLGGGYLLFKNKKPEDDGKNNINIETGYTTKNRGACSISGKNKNGDKTEGETNGTINNGQVEFEPIETEGETNGTINNGQVEFEPIETGGETNGTINKGQVKFEPTKTIVTQKAEEEEKLKNEEVDAAESAHQSLDDYISAEVSENWENVIGSIINPKDPAASIVNANEDTVGIRLSKLRQYLQYCIEVFPRCGDDIQEHIRNYFLQDKNLCDPQKRFMLLYMLSLLERQDLTRQGAVRTLYETIIEINEAMSRKAIERALDDESTAEAKRNVLKRILALIQLSDNRYEYSQQKPWYTGPEAGTEYATSVLSHGETLVFELPYSMNYDELRKLLGIEGDGSAVGIDARTSTHYVKINDWDKRPVEGKSWLSGVTTLGSYTVTKVVSWLGLETDPANRAWWINNLSDLLSKCQFQYGFDIPINSYMPEKGGVSRGHILFSFVEIEGKSALLVKLEDSGPEATSVTGHTHSMSGKGNYISATSHIRVFNQYENRLALTGSLAKFDKEKLCKKVSEIVNTFSSEDLTGSQVSVRAKIDLNELTASLHIPGVDIYRNGSNYCIGNTNYGYIITDMGQLREWCVHNGLNADEIEQIKSSSNRWLYTTESLSGWDLKTALPAKFFNAFSYIKARFTAVKYTNPPGDVIVHDVPPTKLFKSFIFEKFDDWEIAESNVDKNMVEYLKIIIKNSSISDRI